MKYRILTVLLAFAGYCTGQDYSDCRRDLNYAGDKNGYHTLDIYLPKAIKKSYPVVMYVYGSAWLSDNSKGADLNTIGKALLDAGYAVVMPNHRSSIEAVFPAPINDIKAAIRFIRANASVYRLDTTFVGISGSSSGGNMAAMMGTSRGVNYGKMGNITVDIEGKIGDCCSYSSSVDAVVDWFGPTNMLLMDSCGGTDFKHNDARSPASLYIGAPIQDQKDKCLLASPTTYIDPSDPPFLIFHGDKDRVVPYCQGEILFQMLRKAGVPASFYLVEGGQHGPGVLVEKNIRLMVEFFNDCRAKKAMH